MSILFSDLKKKEVIDLSTGSNFGKIVDLLIDEKSGRIIKIIVQGKKNGFLSCENEELSYDCITRIGEDNILFKKCHKIDKDCNSEINCECEDF